MKKIWKNIYNRHQKLINKAGIAGFFFFLLKGLAWLFITYLIIK